MRWTYLIALLLVAGGIALSSLLIPRGKELALQNFRDRDFTEAREAYEARYAAGDRDADTIMPLVRLRLDMGDARIAAKYLEEFVAREPAAIEAREILGEVYKSDERMGDYLHNLEEIVKIRPDFDRLFELFSYYRFFGRYQSMERALERLVELRPLDGDLVVLLAQLRAARQEPALALAGLDDFDEKRQGDMPADARELMIALMVEAGDVERVFAKADRWLGPESKHDAILAVVNPLVAANRSDLAYRLIKRYDERAKTEEALALASADLENVLGLREESRLRLTAWAARETIPDESLGRFLSLAVTAGLPQLALKVAHDRDLALIPEWALAGLAETAFGHKDRPFLDRLVNELGDEFLLDRPILGAEIALARDDKPTAVRWAKRALADQGAPLLDRLTAVRQLVRADQRSQAVAAFDALPLGGALPDEVLSELGTLFIDLDRIPAGFKWFADRRQRAPSTAANVGWARLCARAGEPAQVLAWLEATPEIDGWILRDIAASAADRGPQGAKLALKAAERAYQLARDVESTTALAGAYLTNGRAAEALELIRPLLELGGPAIEYVYTQALQALGRFEELATFLTAKLANGLLEPAEADGVLYTLLANKSYAAVLPYVRERAEKQGGDWLYAWSEAARGLGGAALDAFATHLETQIAQTSLDDAELEKRVFMLVEAAPERGAEALIRLTEAKPGRWWATTAETLRQVGWRDRLGGLLEALIDRADVDTADREAMAFALIDTVGEERALPVTARLADELGGTWDAVYREALVRLKRVPELKTYLARRAERDDLPISERRATVFALLELNDKPAAVEVLKRLAANDGPDGEDASQLYFLWGPRPGDKPLAWLEARAKAATTAETRARWYAKMVELGGAERVLGLIAPKERPGAPAPPTDIAGLRAYAEAKAALNDADGVALAVRAAIKEERSPRALNRLAQLAEGARRNDVAELAWGALLAVKPDDPDALRQVGLRAFDDNRMADAERLLRRYLAGGRQDHEAWFFLGETLTLMNRAGEAGRIYQTALSQLRAVKAPSSFTRQTEAAILNRLGRVDEALAIYRDLRRADPKNRRLTADMANMLIEHRRLEEARNVLASR